MRNLLLVTVLALPGGDEDGLALLRAGRHAEAAAVFRAQLAGGARDAEVAYNLALAAWRAGLKDEAESAAEKAATWSNGRFDALRSGILGALRYDDAMALREQDPARALAQAEQAVQHFRRGALQPDAGPALARNFERALRLAAELRRQAESRPESQPESRPESRSESRPASQPRSDPEPGQERNPTESRPEPRDSQRDQPGENARPPDQERPMDPKGQPQTQEPQPGDDQAQREAPGRDARAREFTPEERKRLEDLLEQLDKAKAQLRAQQRAGRPAVEKDW